MFAAGSSAGGVMALNLAYMTNAWAEKKLKTATEQLCKLDVAANDYKHRFSLKGICSMWGALPDSTMINANNALPTILYHGNNDPVIPFNMGRYGTLCENYPVAYGSECVYRQTVAAGKPVFLNLANGALSPRSWSNNGMTTKIKEASTSVLAKNAKLLYQVFMVMKYVGKIFTGKLPIAETYTLKSLYKNWKISFRILLRKPY